MVSVEILKDGERPKVVAVLGTGIYGLAFAGRVARCSRDGSVVLGSRRGAGDPNERPPPCPVMSYEMAVSSADIVVLAVPADVQSSIIQELGNLLNDKVLVDVSHPPRKWLNGLLCGRACAAKEATPYSSNAEFLTETLKERAIIGTSVVKAFNNVSAHTMSQEPSPSQAYPKLCMISGEDDDAKREVAVLARRMGFGILDLGGLDGAANQEKMMFSYFDQWRYASRLALLATIIFFVAAVLENFAWGPTPWKGMPTKTMLSRSGDVASVFLALTFLPSPIARIWQIARGTSCRPFPVWFGNWMLLRKKFAAVSFTVLIAHVVVACYVSGDVPYIVPQQLSPMFGILAFTLFYIVIACSKSLNSGYFTRKQHRFLFGRMGYFTIVLAIGHIVCVVLIILREEPRVLKQLPTTVIVLALLCLSLVMKIATMLPPLRTGVQRIRAEQQASLLPEWFRTSFGSQESFSPMPTNDSEKFVDRGGINL